jgi:anti-sigma B factor antagonist
VSDTPRRRTAFACPVQHGDDAVVLAPRGELDLATAPAFEAAAEEARAGVHEQLIVDLSGLTFIDSSGMRAILRLHARIGTEMRLTLLPGPWAVQRVFELAGVASVLPFRGAT